MISANLPENERQEQLKSKVLAFMDHILGKLNDRIVLYHDSDPVLYDEDGQWTFDEQKTVQQPDGEMRTETTLDRPLGATPLLSANIMLPEGLCKESCIDSKGNCAAMQLAALLKAPPPWTALSVHLNTTTINCRNLDNTRLMERNNPGEIWVFQVKS